MKSMKGTKGLKKKGNQQRIGRMKRIRTDCHCPQRNQGSSPAFF
jgi:hypothetical protein